MRRLILSIIVLLMFAALASATDTGFKSPTATGEDYNLWTSPSNAFSSNDVYASEGTAGQEQDYYNFGFSIPAGATINGVEVTAEGYCAGTLILNGDRCTIKVDISDNGGTSYGTKISDNWAVDIAEGTSTLGGATSADAYWGLTLTDGDFSNTNFRVRIEADAFTGGATSAELDHIQVKVYYTAAAASPCDCPTTGNFTISGINCTITSTCDLANRNVYLWKAANITCIGCNWYNAGNITITGASAITTKSGGNFTQ